MTYQEMFLDPDVQMTGAGMVRRGGGGGEMISEQNKLCRRHDLQASGVCRKSN